MGLAAIAVSHSGSVSMIRLVGEASESSSLLLKLVLTRGLELFVLGVLGGDAYQLGIDENASAILTHDDLLVHLDLHLALGGNAVEAAAAGIALNDNDAQTVAGVLADALKGG